LNERDTSLPQKEADPTIGGDRDAPGAGPPAAGPPGRRTAGPTEAGEATPTTAPDQMRETNS